jgi:predicted ATP-dependent endonuclease of OLD family
MWFKQFKIKNYRSIVDTGWHDLSSDNITALIGQNESGKTSILESLNSFYTCLITDDILRSDLSLPEVSCSFSLNKKELERIYTEKMVPETVLEIIGSSGQITITRTWNEDKSSYISFGDDEIKKYYSGLEQRENNFEIKTIKDLQKTIDEARNTEEELGQIIFEKEETQKELQNLTPKLKLSKKSQEKNSNKEAQNTLQKLLLENERLKKRLEKKNIAIESRSQKVTDLNKKSRYAQLCLETLDAEKEARIRWKNAYKELTELQNYVDSLHTEKEVKGMQGKLDLANAAYREQDLKLEKAVSKSKFSLAVTARVLKGTDISEAEDIVEKEIKKQQLYYSESELAEESFKNIPVFEMFEDFSSLLPNRIDLDDIFTENKNVEGFKAAKNFLIVSGLQATFFEERSSRILKQKIEKLNNEITLNFQDYWRQNLGRNNKIKIHFELEHYDFSHPDKMGRPYLEFWIKDAQERLYPKQRSRGVRWFLSFYLELKANAIENRDRSRVFLIDEPGLSLHARAQEDVLKVFEDIKDDIQILYSTHSPHLVNLDKLFRLLAVQRAIEDDMKSETLIFNPKSLNEASTDTLSPIYTLMGTKMSDHQFVKKKNNLIVEDTPTYYFLNTILELVGFSKEIYLLPATCVENIPTLVNLLMGWRIDFIVLLDDDLAGNKVRKELRNNIYNNDDELASKKLIRMDHLGSIEDLFSTIDFKNFILHQRVGITESNSEYIELNDLSRAKLASNFVLHVHNNNIKLEDFDDETRGNILQIAKRIDALLI